MSEKIISDRKVNPPYISQPIWTSFFSKMQKVKKPSDLSISILKEYGLGAGQQAALQSALKFLGLIDDSSKTTDLFGKIQVTGDQFKKNLEEIIKTSYSDLLEKHPLDHGSYEDIVNYFSEKFSVPSAKKMAKSLAVLCKLAGLNSPAFSKMRSHGKSENQNNLVKTKRETNKEVYGQTKRGEDASKKKETKGESSEDILKEFIRNNPIPTGIQWDVNTLKAFFDEYRKTIRILKGHSQGEMGDEELNNS